MFFGLFSKRPSPDADRAEAVYAAIVAAARRPGLYADWGAPDTFPGRFELVVLHAALVLRRLRRDGRAEFGQQVFDAMVRALDSNLRELGIGDMAVPKRMKAMASSFFDGAKTYDAALDAEDERMLASDLTRIVFAGEPAVASGTGRLAAYVMSAEKVLAAQPVESLIADGPAFPPLDASKTEEAQP